MIDSAQAARWAYTFEASVTAEAAELAALDAVLGDGDLAENWSRAFAGARVFLDEPADDTPYAVFLAMARGFLQTEAMSCAMFGTFLHGVARGIRGATLRQTGLLAASVHSSMRTVMHRSGARVGDKTMIDAFAPASVAMVAAAKSGTTTEIALAAAARAARLGAEATTAMPGTRGRATKLGRCAVGTADPGAIVVALFFEAGHKAVAGVAAPGLLGMAEAG